MNLDNVVISKVVGSYNHTPSEHIKLIDVVEEIRSEKYKKHTDYLRQESDKIKRTAYKTSKLPAYVFGGDFSYVTKDGTRTIYEYKKGKKTNKIKEIIPGWVKASGLAALDIDIYNDIEQNLQQKQKFMKNKHVVMAFISPSGGLKVIIRIPLVENNDEYYKYYLAALDRFGGNFDTITKDISRLCYVSYDPDVYYNPDAIEFTETKVEEKKVFNTGNDKMSSPKRQNVAPDTETVQKIPKYCAFIEEVASKHELPSDNGAGRQQHLSGNVYVYSEKNNKPEVLQGFVDAQGRPPGWDNNAENWEFSCGPIIKYARKNEHNKYVKQGLISCTKDCEHYKKYIEELEKKKNLFYLDKESEIDETEIVCEKKNLNFSKLLGYNNSNKHLKNYDIFERELGIDGEQYNTLKIALYYYLNSIAQETQVYQINRKNVIDNRIHLLIITTPGKGKSTIKNMIKSVLDEEDYSEITSLSSPEQLIGKVKQSKKKDEPPEEIKGYLGNKCLVNDESQDLLNEKNEIYAKGQRIKRLAMDTYGFNTISKKLVDDSNENKLRYDPPTRILDFAHPVKLEGSFFDTGSFRRYAIFYPKISKTIDLDKVTELFFDDDEEEDKCFRDVTNKDYVNVKFTQDTLKIITVTHKALLQFLLKSKNDNAYRYGLYTCYSMRNVIMKYIYVLSIIKKETETSNQTALEACCDAMSFILSSVETIDELGNMSLSRDVWKGLGEEDALVLEYLHREGALSEESSTVTIHKFWTVLANIYGCKKTQARKHYYRLKNSGFISSSRKNAQSDSKVWLLFYPDIIKLENDSFDPIEELKVTVTSVLPLLTLTQKMFSDEKLYQMGATDTTVTLYRYILIKKTLVCSEFSKNKNKINNNIEKGGASSDTCDSSTISKQSPDDTEQKSNCQNTQKSCDSYSKSDGFLKKIKQICQTNPDGVSELILLDQFEDSDLLYSTLEKYNNKEIIGYRKDGGLFWKVLE